MTKYWCHSCSEVVTIDNPQGDVACPKCSSEFIEEYEAQPQQQQQPQPPPPQRQRQQPEPTPTVDPFAQNIFSLFNTITARQQRNRAAAAAAATATTGGRQGQQRQQRPGVSFRVVNYNSAGQPVGIRTMTFGNGAQGVPLGNNNGIQSLFNLFGAPEMYRVGDREMTFDELLSHLFQASKAKGTPPASKEAVEKLRTVKVTQEHVDAEIGCAVCQEPLAVGEEVTELPCKHLYHHDCITPWLKMHNSCPECRYELPTDDADYENEKKRKMEKEKEEEKKKKDEEEEAAKKENEEREKNESNNIKKEEDKDKDDDDDDYNPLYI